MIISRARSFVFVHIPKNGGTVFRSLLAPYHDYPREFWWLQQTEFLDLPLDHGHLRSWEIQMFYPEVWDIIGKSRTLCFFRNPAERYVSALYEHYKLFRQETDLPALPWPEQQRIARQFTSDFDIRTALSGHFRVHFSPQTWFTHLHDRRVVEMVLPLIDGFDAFRAAAMFLGLPDIGPQGRIAPQRDPGDLLGDELLARVQTFYRADYEFCAAHDPLKPLLTP